jgi:hypothetical protein
MGQQTTATDRKLESASQRTRRAFILTQAAVTSRIEIHQLSIYLPSVQKDESGMLMRQGFGVVTDDDRHPKIRFFFSPFFFFKRIIE